jgi:6,7-dimethyl-8-ribityllumazine synthase
VRLPVLPSKNAQREKLNAKGLRIGLVVSRFNQFITDRLHAGALDALHQSGATDDQIETIFVPGAFELPIAAKKLALARKVDAIVCIGCVLRGETSHYDYVASETARGILLAQMDTGVPMAFCVLTCDTLEQAIDRAGLKGGNKGYESALGAIEMARVAKKLRVPSMPRTNHKAGNSPRAKKAARKRFRNS